MQGSFSAVSKPILAIEYSLEYGFCSKKGLRKKTWKTTKTNERYNEKKIGIKYTFNQLLFNISQLSAKRQELLRFHIFGRNTPISRRILWAKVWRRSFGFFRLDTSSPTPAARYPGISPSSSFRPSTSFAPFTKWRLEQWSDQPIQLMSSFHLRSPDLLHSIFDREITAELRGALRWRLWPLQLMQRPLLAPPWPL